MAYALRDFGSYTVGGRVAHVTKGAPRTIRFTRETEYTYDPRGHFAVEQTYVQFFVPERARDLPPVVLVHGGGMHGGVWETTPDGRPGWLHGLLDAGREVHVVDAVERGRAGFAAGVWTEAPILRSMEEAWVLFRIGPADTFEVRRPFPGQQFPVGAFDAFARTWVPRWLGTSPVQSAGVGAVLDRLPSPTVICHSQGAELVFDAIAERPARAAAVVAVEPSSLPRDPAQVPFSLLVAHGDFLDTADLWSERAERWQKFVTGVSRASGTAKVLDTADAVARGGSHMIMVDMHSRTCLEAILASTA